MKIFEFQSPVSIHRELNPTLWDNETLRKDVNRALMRIAGEFYKFLNVDAELEDILITGSQVNYNYGPKSDLDLHLVIDFRSVDCEGGARELFDTKRALWHQEHDITIHGIDVECYVEDINDTTVSATYSLMRGKWLEKPEPVSVDYDINTVRKIVQKWEEKINKAIDSGSLAKCRNTRAQLKLFRVKSLAQDGEYGPGNMAFKTLRNTEYISKLMAAIRALNDQRLSI
jgi:hypothetical protein